jgi:hypothetical protein
MALYDMTTSNNYNWQIVYTASLIAALLNYNFNLTVDAAQSMAVLEDIDLLLVMVFKLYTVRSLLSLAQ